MELMRPAEPVLGSPSPWGPQGSDAPTQKGPGSVSLLPLLHSEPARGVDAADFLRLQLANKERSALRAQQLEQQQRRTAEQAAAAGRAPEAREQKEQRAAAGGGEGAPWHLGSLPGCPMWPWVPSRGQPAGALTPELRRRRWPRALYQQVWCDLDVVTSETGEGFSPLFQSYSGITFLVRLP